jgi:hypothetical protein
MAQVMVLAVGWLVADPSKAAAAVIPAEYALVWHGFLLVSAVAGIGSAWTATRDEPLSLLLERLALIGVGLYALFYALILVAVFDTRGWMTEIIFLSITVACGVRLEQVRRRIRWLKGQGRPTVIWRRR